MVAEYKGQPAFSVQKSHFLGLKKGLQENVVSEKERTRILDTASHGLCKAPAGGAKVKLSYPSDYVTVEFKVQLYRVLVCQMYKEKNPLEISFLSGPNDKAFKLLSVLTEYKELVF